MHQVSNLLHNTGQLTQSGNSSLGSCRQIPNADRTMEVALSSALPSFTFKHSGACAKKDVGPRRLRLTQHLKSASSRAFLFSSLKHRGQPRSLDCVFFSTFSAALVCHPGSRTLYHPLTTVQPRFQILFRQQQSLLWKAERLVPLSHNKKSFRASILTGTPEQLVVQNGRVPGCEDSAHERVQRAPEREMGEHRGK